MDIVIKSRNLIINIYRDCLKWYNVTSFRACLPEGRERSNLNLMVIIYTGLLRFARSDKNQPFETGS